MPSSRVLQQLQAMGLLCLAISTLLNTKWQMSQPITIQQISNNSKTAVSPASKAPSSLGEALNAPQIKAISTLSSSRKE